MMRFFGANAGQGLGSLARDAVALVPNVARFLCLLHCTDTYLFSSLTVHGPSMLPTLNQTGDVLIVDRFSHRMGQIRRGDIVCLQSPTNPLRSISKRVTAVEGDAVTYLPTSSRSEITKTITVPKGHIWIQGDNMYASMDSRAYGPLPVGLVKGKVLLRVWPPSGFGTLE